MPKTNVYIYNPRDPIVKSNLQELIRTLTDLLAPLSKNLDADEISVTTGPFNQLQMRICTRSNGVTVIPLAQEPGEPCAPSSLDCIDRNARVHIELVARNLLAVGLFLYTFRPDRPEDKGLCVFIEPFKNS
jgi:hypothetical protein